MRLFQVPLFTITEHPTDLPASERKIQLGELSDWECYAPGHRPNEIIQFTPTIEEDNFHLFIQVPKSYKFWFFEMDENLLDGKLLRPRWEQSGQSLRFIRKKRKESIWSTTKDT